MSRIFEALQHAEKERLRRRKAVEEQKNIPKGNVDRILTVGMTDPHHCVEFAVLVGREGPVDFLYRMAGMYPWQCSRCRRCFHRFQR